MVAQKAPFIEQVTIRWLPLSDKCPQKNILAKNMILMEGSLSEMY